MGILTPTPTPLGGLYEIRTTHVVDARGSFARLFCEHDFASIRVGLHFTQVNLSRTTHKGSVRGMHYQRLPVAEAKLVQCLRGRVFDVAVDVRAGSPTFLRWHAIELSDENNLAVFIPEGFAHGFQALSDDAQLLYMHTNNWTPACEAGLRHDDPQLAVSWPIPITLVSERDASFPLLDSTFAGVSL